MTTTTPAQLHPAQYSPQLVPILAECLQQADPTISAGGILLDPFAGLGWRLTQIATLAGIRPDQVVGVELETGYFTAHQTAPCVIQGDATHLPFADGSVRAIVTSPTYPNGMNDDFVALDNSRRNTYIHRLRAALGDQDYELHPSSTARHGVRGGRKSIARYEALHAAAWAEAWRVLEPDGILILNTKDVLYDSGRDHYHTQHQHRDLLIDAGFWAVARAAVECPGVRHGANTGSVVATEDVWTYRRLR